MRLQPIDNNENDCQSTIAKIFHKLSNQTFNWHLPTIRHEINNKHFRLGNSCCTWFSKEILHFSCQLGRGSCSQASIEDKTKCLQFRMIVDTANQTFLILNNQQSEENWLSPSWRHLAFSRRWTALWDDIKQLYTLIVEPAFLEFLISILPFGKAFQQKRRCLIIKSCPSDKAFWCSICISFNPTSHLN